MRHAGTYALTWDEAEDAAAAGDTTARSSRCARDAGMMAVEAAN
jgi:hypothetical protein